MHKISMLGAGFIGMLYTTTLHSGRGTDRVQVVYSRTLEHAQELADQFDIPKATSDLTEAINDPYTDIVVIGLPNDQHLQAALLAAKAGKAVLCTKPLARTAAEARQILAAVEQAGVFHGYLEDMVYTPKTLKALQSIRAGALGKVLWARSRETHSGPYSGWFWDKQIAGGGALLDMGCHSIEVNRAFIGKDIRPVEVVCWADAQVHPIEAEDSAVGLVRYANGAIGQFEVSWTFRGGMDLRDEVFGTEGTIFLNHWLRTGFDLFTTVGEKGYVNDKAQGDTGWLFPVGDETDSLGYTSMFADMLDALDRGIQPRETFYDGYIVNAIMDAAYRSAQSKRWEPVEIEDWRGLEQVDEAGVSKDYDADHFLIKEQLLPDGKTMLILREKTSGLIIQKFMD